MAPTFVDFEACVDVADEETVVEVLSDEETVVGVVKRLLLEPV
jgi:hypothetical protein